MTDILTPLERSVLMGRIRGEDTKPELFVRRALHALGYRFRVHVRSLPGTPDVVFSRRRKAVFVHGCFWHRHGCRKTYTPKSRKQFWQAKFAANFPAARVSAGTVEEQEPRRIVEQVGRIDLLLASPECTNHSCARGARPRSDRSRDLAFEVVRYARAIAPRWIVIENVIQMRSWSRYRELLAALGDAGYRVAEHVLDAADHGVPQRRRRLFLLCDREAEPPSRIPGRRGPKPSATRVLDRPGSWRRSPLDNGRRAPATLARARRAGAALGSDSPFLIVYYGNDGAGGWQPLTVPLLTVTTLDRFGLCEPSRDGATLRMLQVPELARAMGFQDDPSLRRGSRRDRVMLLGNAVCPPVMEAVVRALAGREALDSDAGSPGSGAPGRGDVDAGSGDGSRRSRPDPDAAREDVLLKDAPLKMVA